MPVESEEKPGPTQQQLHQLATNTINYFKHETEVIYADNHFRMGSH